MLCVCCRASPGSEPQLCHPEQALHLPQLRVPHLLTGHNDISLAESLSTESDGLKRLYQAGRRRGADGAPQSSLSSAGLGGTGAWGQRSGCSSPWRPREAQ